MSEHGTSTPPRSPPAKRKKLSTACEACARRKSRCEMITARGCHRCRTLGTTCSRAAAPGSSGYADVLGGPAEPSAAPYSRNGSVHEGSPADGLAGGAMDAIEEIQQRTRRIEGILSGMASMARRGNELAPVPAQRQQHGPAGPSAHTGGEAPSLGASAFTSYALHLRGVSLRDPVEAGVVSLSHWGLVYAGFRRAIRQILPLDNVLPVDPPTNAMLRTCILIYSHHANPIASGPDRGYAPLLSLLRANLDHLPMVSPSREIVSALLILSLAPPAPGSAEMSCPIDRYDAAARAQAAARVVGLDLAAGRVDRMGSDDAQRDWARDDVRDACLWHAVTNRATWVATLMSPVLSIGLIPMGMQVAPPDDTLLLQLALEDRLCGIRSPILDAYRRLLTARIYVPEDMDALLRTTSEYQALLPSWKEQVLAAVSTCPSAPFVLLSQSLFDIILHLRLSSHRNLPTPLGRDIIARFVKEYANGILRSGVTAMLVVLQHDVPLATLPAYHITLLLIAYLAQSQSRKLDAAMPQPPDRPASGQTSTPSTTHTAPFADSQGDMTPAQQDEIRTRILRAHPQYAGVIARLDGREAPVEMGEAIRELQREGAWAWEQMFDFDLFFGLESGWGEGPGVGGLWADEGGIVDMGGLGVAPEWLPGAGYAP